MLSAFFVALGCRDECKERWNRRRQIGGRDTNRERLTGLNEVEFGWLLQSRDSGKVTWQVRTFAGSDGIASFSAVPLAVGSASAAGCDRKWSRGVSFQGVQHRWARRHSTFGFCSDRARRQA